MAESNATQVILTDDGLKIINAQATADNAASGVTNLNDSSKLGPAEKQELSRKYRANKALYNIDIKMLTDAGLPTTDLQSAMTALDNFITPYFIDMGKTEQVNRDQLNQVFTGFDTADKNASSAFNDMISNAANDAKKAGDDAKATGEKAQAAGKAASQAASQAQADATQAKSDAATAQQKAQSSIDQLNKASTKFDGEITEAKTSASQAQSSADNAFSQAQAFGSQATSAIAVQSAATAKAQSAADNALSSASSAVAKAESTASEFGKVSQKADGAFDNALSAQSDASAAVAQASSAAADSKDAKQIAGAVSQSYKTLTDGSTMTIAELQSGLAVKLTKADLDGYVTQTWAQNQIKTTADGINGTISSIKSTVDGQTTDINELKADSSGFKTQFTTVNNTLGKQTTDIGSLQASSKELTSGFNTLTSDNTTNKNDISQLKQTATEVSSTLETVKTQVQNSAVGTNLLTGTAKCEFPLNNNGGIQTIQKYDDGTNYIQHTSDTPNDSMGTWWPLTPELGQVYTLSADVCGNGYIQGDEFRYEGGDNGSLGRVDLTDGWQRISNTFHINTIGGWVNWIIYANNSTLLKVKHIKVEKGSLATDWCPNPEDQATKSQITQLSGEIAQKVDSGDFSSYKTQTADLIASKVANSDFSTYKTQTAELIGSKVSSNDFESYKTQTADAISSKVSTADFNNLEISNRNLALGTAKAFTMTGNNSVNNSTDMYSLSSAIPKGTTITVAFDVTSTNATGVYNIRFPFGAWQSFVTAPLFSGTQHQSYTIVTNSDYTKVGIRLDNSTSTVTVSNLIISESSKEVSWTPAPEDLATSTEFDQISNAIKLKVNSSDVTSQITESINNINLKVANANGSSSQVNVNDNTILLDANKIIFSGNTSILDGTIGTAKIANAAINTAQIADGAINNAKIANAAIDDAKISNLNGNKIIAGSITAQQLNADDIIANVINGKTINGITINAPTMNLGKNGTLSEDWELDQDANWFSPVRGSGVTTLNAGVLRTKGESQRYWSDSDDPYWYGVSPDHKTRIRNGKNITISDYAPGYVKHDICVDGGTADVIYRSYLDGVGLFFTEGSTNTYSTLLSQKGLSTSGSILVAAESEFKNDLYVDKWLYAGTEGGTGIKIGYRTIQVNSSDLYLNGSDGNQSATIHGKKFATSSVLSRKKDISPLDEERAMQTIMNTDIYQYHYKEETVSQPFNYSVIIDDENQVSQYRTPKEFIVADKTGRDDGNTIGFLVQALKNANRRIKKLEEYVNG